MHRFDHVANLIRRDVALEAVIEGAFLHLSDDEAEERDAEVAHVLVRGRSAAVSGRCEPRERGDEVVALGLERPDLVPELSEVGVVLLLLDARFVVALVRQLTLRLIDLFGADVEDEADEDEREHPDEYGAEPASHGIGMDDELRSPGG